MDKLELSDFIEEGDYSKMWVTPINGVDISDGVVIHVWQVGPEDQSQENAVITLTKEQIRKLITFLHSGVDIPL